MNKLIKLNNGVEVEIETEIDGKTIKPLGRSFTLLEENKLKKCKDKYEIANVIGEIVKNDLVIKIQNQFKRNPLKPIKISLF